jgi:hypothetical protein
MHRSLMAPEVFPVSKGYTTVPFGAAVGFDVRSAVATRVLVLSIGAFQQTDPEDQRIFTEYLSTPMTSSKSHRCSDPWYRS